jgi:hypothetical protein
MEEDFENVYEILPNLPLGKEGMSTAAFYFGYEKYY